MPDPSRPWSYGVAAPADPRAQSSSMLEAVVRGELVRKGYERDKIEEALDRLRKAQEEDRKLFRTPQARADDARDSRVQQRLAADQGGIPTIEAMMQAQQPRDPLSEIGLPREMAEQARESRLAQRDAAMQPPQNEFAQRLAASQAAGQQLPQGGAPWAQLPDINLPQFGLPDLNMPEGAVSGPDIAPIGEWPWARWITGGAHESFGDWRNATRGGMPGYVATMREADADATQAVTAVQGATQDGRAAIDSRFPQPPGQKPPAPEMGAAAAQAGMPQQAPPTAPEPIPPVPGMKPPMTADTSLPPGATPVEGLPWLQDGGAAQPQQAQGSQGPQPQDWRDLGRFGMSLMAYGAQPGATFAGAFGRAGLDMKDLSEARRQSKLERQTEAEQTSYDRMRDAVKDQKWAAEHQLDIAKAENEATADQISAQTKQLLARISAENQRLDRRLRALGISMDVQKQIYDVAEYYDEQIRQAAMDLSIEPREGQTADEAVQEHIQELKREKRTKMRQLEQEAQSLRSMSTGGGVPEAPQPEQEEPPAPTMGQIDTAPVSELRDYVARASEAELDALPEDVRQRLYERLQAGQ